jgi:UDP:flavonoid glycosyltransferase YjiC (YdhE family)
VRILLSSTSGYGHVFPMLPLARAFQAGGHDVLWALSADSTGLAAAAGIPTAPAGAAGEELRSLRRQVLETAEGVAPPERAGFVFPRMFGGGFTAPMLRDLLPLAETWCPDLLVHENGELAAPIVGGVLGVPNVTHAFGGAVPPAFLAEAGVHVEDLWLAHGLEPAPYAGCFTSTYLDICPVSVQTVPTGHIPLAQALQPVADTGPAPDALPGYLEQDGRPLVFLTLGTVRNQSPVLRSAVEALASLPVRLLVTVGPDGDPAALGEQPAHAGSGTFLGALSRGLPQLCLPQAADQFRNAEGGARSRAALVLAPGEVTPDAIAGAVSRLLAEPSFRDAAGRVALEIAAMPSPGEVAHLLVERFG